MPGMGILGPKAGAIITAWQHAATCKSKLHDGTIIDNLLWTQIAHEFMTP